MCIGPRQFRYSLWAGVPFEQTSEGVPYPRQHLSLSEPLFWCVTQRVDPISGSSARASNQRLDRVRHPSGSGLIGVERAFEGILPSLSFVLVAVGSHSSSSSFSDPLMRQVEYPIFWIFPSKIYSFFFFFCPDPFFSMGPKEIGSI